MDISVDDSSSYVLTYSHGTETLIALLPFTFVFVLFFAIICCRGWLPGNGIRLTVGLISSRS